MNYTGTSDAIQISNGWINICIDGDTLATTIEYSPDDGTTWFPLQEYVEVDRVITTTATFNVLLPSGKLRFNGGTNVTAFAIPIND